MKRLFLLCILTFILFIAACGKQEEATTAEGGQLDIYTTVYPLQYFTERIGGNEVKVQSIYPPGANEHTFEPTQKDMIALADADLFFYIGLGLEGFVENAKKTLAEENVEMVAVIDGVPDSALEVNVDEHDHHDEEDSEAHDHASDTTEEGHEGHDHGDTDPHVWISPKISQDLALTVKNKLVKSSPENEKLFEENYQALVSELQQLDTDFEEMSHAASSKTFFVSHAAFGYLADTYGLEQIAIAGLNSQQEPSQKELTKIIDMAKEKNVEYILFEQNVNSKLTEVIQKEIGAESLVLHNLGVLSKEDIANEETYFTLMQKNLETLKTALN
ncbi:zinc ABC transporter substrate-binding protein [Psychrobacillus sp. FSL W7-1457]|uniref:metal ABC transporter solute-binding protein, Zn/Mn family n=1 Tax=unclassified Psychrobacillus TaxID=2636677 RepID=UPI0030F67DF9